MQYKSLHFLFQPLEAASKSKLIPHFSFLLATLNESATQHSSIVFINLQFPTVTFDICRTTDIKIHQKCVESNLQRAAVVSCCCNTEPTDAFLYHCVCIYPFKHNTTLRVQTKYSIQHTLNSSCWQTMLDNRKMILKKQ